MYPGSITGEQCPNGSFPYDPVAIGSTLYFAADDGIHGFELWKTDGSEGGTQRMTEHQRIRSLVSHLRHECWRHALLRRH